MFEYLSTKRIESNIFAELLTWIQVTTWIPHTEYDWSETGRCMENGTLEHYYKAKLNPFRTTRGRTVSRIIEFRSYPFYKENTSRWAKIGVCDSWNYSNSAKEFWKTDSSALSLPCHRSKIFLCFQDTCLFFSFKLVSFKIFILN